MKQAYAINPLLVLFKWDDFTRPEDPDYEQLGEKEATTARGWCFLQQHPDAEWMDETSSFCVGNYVEYPEENRESGRTYHAVAYCFRYDELTRGQSNIRLGSVWCASAIEARAWIEGKVAEYLGRL